MRELGRPFRPPVAVAVAIRLAISATRVAQAVLVAQVLGHVLHGSGRVGPALGLAAALGAARLVLVWTSDLQATTASGRVRAVLRARLYRHLTELGPGYLVRHRTGGVESVLVEGVERLGSYYGEFVPLALASIVSVVGVLVWVAVLDPITAGVMVMAALLVPVAPVLTARAFGETGRQSSEGLGRLASEHLDAIQGLVRLKAFNAADRWGRRLTGEEQDGQHCRPRHRVVGHPHGAQGNAEDGASSHAQADKANVDAGQPTERRHVGGELLAASEGAPGPPSRHHQTLPVL